MDRFEPPLLGRRRGWLALCQFALAAVLWWMSHLSPSATPVLFAAAAVLVAFLSASQDVVVDAYRTDLLPEAERGLGASVHVFAYRLAMILSGGIALIWAGQWQSWPRVYQTMAMILCGCGFVSLLALPRVRAALRPPDSDAGRELFGFAAMLGGVAAGYWIARQALVLLGLSPDDANKWVQLLFVVAEIAVALPLGGVGGARARGFRHTQPFAGKLFRPTRRGCLPRPDCSLQARRRFRRQPDHPLSAQGLGGSRKRKWASPIRSSASG